ncbi:MAG: hypothetical protein M1546_02065 [Chloroflexi bacterium]|nr:hypothetical protein [Chloroflexota bacterium]
MQQWEYMFAQCHYDADQQQWLIKLQKEFELYEGVRLLGQNGWELAGIQTQTAATGGKSVEYYCPSSLYIFKREMAAQGEPG